MSRRTRLEFTARKHERDTLIPMNPLRIIAYVLTACVVFCVVIWYVLPKFAPAYVVRVSPSLAQVMATYARHKNESGLYEALEKRLKSASVNDRAFALETLRSGSGEAKIGAVTVCGMLKVQEAVSVLVSLATVSLEGDIRKDAVWALGNIHDEAGLPAIITATGDSDSNVRLMAIRMAGRYAPSINRSVFVARVVDSDYLVRYEVVRSLANYDIADCVTELMPLLNDKEAAIRHEAIKILSSQLSNSAVIEAIQNKLLDSEASVRECAKIALKNHKGL